MGGQWIIWTHCCGCVVFIDQESGTESFDCIESVLFIFSLWCGFCTRMSSGGIRWRVLHSVIIWNAQFLRLVNWQRNLNKIEKNRELYSKPKFHVKYSKDEWILLLYSLFHTLVTIQKCLISELLSAESPCRRELIAMSPMFF